MKVDRKELVMILGESLATLKHPCCPIDSVCLYVDTKFGMPKNPCKHLKMNNAGKSAECTYRKEDCNA